LLDRPRLKPWGQTHVQRFSVETLTGHALTYGEAVAIGLALNARYSVLACLLPRSQDERIRRLLGVLGFDLWNDGLAERDRSDRLVVLQGLRDVQEHLEGELTVTVLGGIGRGVDVHDIGPDLVEQASAWLAERCG
jgi:3-dehydroquinate synthase